MKIAIPTNDRKTIAKRTGRATEFAFFHIENGTITNVKYIKNRHEHHEHSRNEGNHRTGNLQKKNLGLHKNENQHSHDEVINLLKDVSVFLVRAVGKYMKQDLINGNIPYQLVKEEELIKIIKNYLEKTL